MYFKQVSFLSLWYDPSAQYPGQACICLGLLLWSKWSCGSICIPGRCHPLGRTAGASLVIQTAFILSLTLPQPHRMRSLFPVPLCSRQILRSTRWDEFCCHTCSAPSTNGQSEKLRTKQRACGWFLCRQTDLQSCRAKLFSLSSQSNPSFLTQLKLSFVQSEWPLTRGLPAQFVSPLIMVIHYPALHIKTHTGSSQTRELGRWAVGKKSSNLYKLCCSKVSFLFLLSRRKRFLPIQMNIPIHRSSVYNWSLQY